LRDSLAEIKALGEPERTGLM